MRDCALLKAESQVFLMKSRLCIHPQDIVSRDPSKSMRAIAKELRVAALHNQANSEGGSSLPAVFRIRIRIHVFSGLPDPDPLVRGMDPDPNPTLDLDPDPSIIKQI
jgi:hypothetical protein